LSVIAAALSSSSTSSTLNDVEPGLLGFLIVAAIGVALVFLLLSMNKQFRKLGPPPEESVETDKDTGDGAPDTGDGGLDANIGDPAAKGAKRR
jgi:hypothetical protein